MFRVAVLLFSLFTALGATAQHTGDTTSKNTEKKGATEIDYRQWGAPMPPLRYIKYVDTTSKRDATGMVIETPKKKKKKHKGEQPAAKGATTVLTNKDVDNGANLFMMIFNPTCSHCEEETFMIEKNIGLFKKTKLMLIATPQMQPYLTEFYKLLHLENFTDVISLGVDSSRYIDNIFLYQTLPQINVFSGAERKLIKTYSGEVTIDTLRKYIE